MKINKLWVIFFCFIACNQRDKAKASLSRYINTVSVNSNHAIEISTHNQFDQLKGLNKELLHKECAQSYMPKAEKCIEITYNTVHYLDSLSTIVLKKRSLNEKDYLFEKLKEYEGNIMGLDVDASQALFSRGVLLTDDRDSFNIHKLNKNQFYNQFINELTKEDCINFLSNVASDIIYNSNKFVDYCKQKCSFSICRFDAPMQPLISQNSKKLKPNELLEISAGIGFFSSTCHPTIIIDRKKIPLGPDGVALYRLKVSKDTGLYSVPIKVTFTKQDGQKVTLEKEILYLVE